MSNSLVDLQGFPRSDVDVYTIRHTRAQLIRLSNDHASLLKQIEQGLHQLHSLAKLQNISQLESPAHLIPFARVDGVAPESPASEAGLLRDDLLLQFASLKSTNAFAQLPLVVKEYENVHLLLINAIEPALFDCKTRSRNARIDIDTQSVVRKRTFGLPSCTRLIDLCGIVARKISFFGTLNDGL